LEEDRGGRKSASEAGKGREILPTLDEKKGAPLNFLGGVMEGALPLEEKGEKERIPSCQRRPTLSRVKKE